MRLPGSLAEIAEIIGANMTLRLESVAKPDHSSKRKRGYRIRIPHDPVDDHHPLVRTIGREGATRLQRQYAGETISYAARSARRLQRALMIAKDFQSGVSIDGLQVRYSCSFSTVSRALGEVTTRDLTTMTTPPLGSSPGGSMRVQGSTT